MNTNAIFAFLGLSLFTPQSFAQQASSQLQYARIATQTLECVLGDTLETVLESGTIVHKADLSVKGFSLAPAVWDPVADTWRDLRNEPLFVFGPNADARSDMNITVQVMHKLYITPLVTNIGVASSAIGTPVDMPFEAKYRLEFFDLSRPSELSKQVYVNYFKACDLRYNQESKAWEMVQAEN